MLRGISVFTLLLFCIGTSGCGDGEEDIAVYDIPKEEPVTGNQPTSTPAANPPVMGQTVLPGMEEAASRFGNPKWAPPSSWTKQSGSSVRIGSWTAKGPQGGTADISVTAFPGDVGGLLANVNRWRSEIGLPLIDEAAMRSETEPFDVGEYPASMIFLENIDSGEGTAGVIVPVGNATWFFKMSGPLNAVYVELDNFLEFAGTTQLPAPQ